jgi:hypothetical protein
MYLKNDKKKTGAFEKQGRSLKIFTFKIGILKNEVDSLKKLCVLKGAY